ncbi:MAG: hypothetical protein HQM13_19095 [SAR324 cluster bacterium]|nr:hypothetical protein [SAR324 cluster bacterium]
MKKKIGFAISILIFLILFRYMYLHLEGTKELVAWLKGNIGWKTLLIGGIAYMLLLSIPFFPGVELGWFLILVFGKEGILLVYFMTLCGLSLSFAIGRWFEKSWLTSWLDLDALKSMFHDQAAKVLKRWFHWRRKPVSVLPYDYFLYKYRYLILTLLINIPGNAIIGGGGGISFICGMNQLFSWKGFLLTIIFAIAPLPLLLYFGIVQIETLLF